MNRASPVVRIADDVLTVLSPQVSAVAVQFVSRIAGLAVIEPGVTEALEAGDENLLAPGRAQDHWNTLPRSRTPWDTGFAPAEPSSCF